MENLTVCVVGGGTVGLAVAWTLARRGASVTVADPSPGSGASWVAGGMLAPYSEAWPGEEELVRLGIESLRLWDEFERDLREYADGELITARGTVWFAVDEADAGELRTMHGAASIGEPDSFVTLRPSEAVRLVPGAAPRVRAAAYARTELAVDNRILHRTLVNACIHEGVQITADRIVDVDQVEADAVIVCAGSESTELLPDLCVRPVKGEVVRLRRTPGALPPPAVTVRAKVRGRHVYVVPRADGVVVGATQYENDRDLATRIGPVVDLLADAFTVLPFLREYDLAEISAGLRPMTTDSVPVIERVRTGVYAATGHGRNGILLAPLTAVAVADMLTEQEEQVWN